MYYELTFPQSSQRSSLITLPLKMQRLEESKSGSHAILNNRKSEPDEDENQTGMAPISAMGAVATGTFTTGLVLFLLAFASTDWVGIENGMALSLWRTCSRSYVDGAWTCEPWERIPGKCCLKRHPYTTTTCSNTNCYNSSSSNNNCYILLLSAPQPLQISKAKTI